MNKIIILMSALILMTGIVFAISSEVTDKPRISDSSPEVVSTELESIVSIDGKLGEIPSDLDIPKEPEEATKDSKDDGLSTLTVDEEPEEPKIKDDMDILEEPDVPIVKQENDSVGDDSPDIPEGILGDLDNDGDVDKFDLQILLDAWGPCNTKICIEDLDNDRIVGVSDLLILLGNWTGDFTGGFIADLNNDCVVGVEDLLILLGLWGECEDCVADINNDGVVDKKDLNILVKNWGIVPNCGDGDDDVGTEVEVKITPIEFTNSRLFTRYGWDGIECVKMDLVTKPGKTKHISFDNPNLRAFQINGEKFAYRLIEGNRALAWEPNKKTGFGKRVREASCDKSVIENNPLPITWWRNSHNQALYIQYIQFIQ